MCQNDLNWYGDSRNCRAHSESSELDLAENPPIKCQNFWERIALCSTAILYPYFHRVHARQFEGFFLLQRARGGGGYISYIFVHLDLYRVVTFFTRGKFFNNDYLSSRSQVSMVYLSNRVLTSFYGLSADKPRGMFEEQEKNS